MEDREAIKYTLGASLVKSSSHWRAYETAFEIYFSLRGPEYRIDDDQDDSGQLATDDAGQMHGQGQQQRPGPRPGGRRRARG